MIESIFKKMKNYEKENFTFKYRIQTCQIILISRINEIESNLIL